MNIEVGDIWIFKTDGGPVLVEEILCSEEIHGITEYEFVGLDIEQGEHDVFRYNIYNRKSWSKIS